MAKELIVYAPLSGKVKETSKVADPVFAEDMMGKGFAITPDLDQEEVLCPIKKGKLEVAFPTGHAYGVNGKVASILVHIGIDTVTLDGEGFERLSNQGDKVKLGQVLGKVDLKLVKSKAPSIDTMVIATMETLGEGTIERIAGNTVKAGEPLFKVIK